MKRQLFAIDPSDIGTLPHSHTFAPVRRVAVPGPIRYRVEGSSGFWTPQWGASIAGMLMGDGYDAWNVSEVRGYRNVPVGSQNAFSDAFNSSQEARGGAVSLYYCGPPHGGRAAVNAHGPVSPEAGQGVDMNCNFRPRGDPRVATLSYKL